MILEQVLEKISSFIKVFWITCMTVSTSERYRSMVESSTVTTGSVDFKMTVSLGATLACAGDTLDSLVKRADGLMYQSKLAGRNRVTLG
jgi:PleD family two-component response regulator